MFFAVFVPGDSLSNGRYLTLSHVLDGTSNVMFVGESATQVGDIKYFAASWLGAGNPGDLGDGPGGNQDVSLDAATTAGAHRAVRRAKHDIELNTARLNNANKAFSSCHPGGGNFVFGDGNVRLIADTVSGSLYDVLPMRDSGESKSF
jgi:prepilin-type processing-associated H-X9-DG protein